MAYIQIPIPTGGREFDHQMRPLRRSRHQRLARFHGCPRERLRLLRCCRPPGRPRRSACPVTAAIHSPAFCNVIAHQVGLEEVRALSLQLYTPLRSVTGPAVKWYYEFHNEFRTEPLVNTLTLAHRQGRETRVTLTFSTMSFGRSPA